MTPVDCSLPGSSVHGIFQARILEWVAMLFSRGSSQHRDWTWISCIAGGFSTLCATAEAHLLWINVNFCTAEFPHFYSFCAYSIWRIQALWRWLLENTLEKRMATHFSVLAWRIPWTEEPGGLQSVGLQRAGHDWAQLTLSRDLSLPSTYAELSFCIFILNTCLAFQN